jgi:hypothetical protein
MNSWLEERGSNFRVELQPAIHDDVRISGDLKWTGSYRMDAGLVYII